MLSQISQEIRNTLRNFTEEDSIIFNNKTYKIDKDNFSQIISNNNKSIAFIDGGQAEILSAGNFCLSFIRVSAQVFENNKKTKSYNHEFFLFTKAVYKEDIYYESKIFGDKLVDESDLLISSNDTSIKIGSERAPISKVTNMARRFAELALANNVNTDFIILDGTLEKTFNNEELYLNKLNNASALAKSSSLFTTSGNSPIVLLNKIGPNTHWQYQLNENTSFVKLNEKTKHVFRFEGNKEVLPFLTNNCSDAIFLGYPYGLILADKMARVSNAEKNSLMMRFLLKEENKEIAEYLNSMNAHGILDSIG